MLVERTSQFEIECTCEQILGRAESSHYTMMGTPRIPLIFHVLPIKCVNTAISASAEAQQSQISLSKAAIYTIVSTLLALISVYGSVAAQTQGRLELVHILRKDKSQMRCL